MSTYDLKRLETAIQYIRRMTEGRNPVTNRPAPENEVLINTNVNRCLKFVQEVLEDVHAAGGTVGKPPRRTAAPKPQVSETFPYEVLDSFRYTQDQQISYFLKQIADLLPEDQEMKVKVTMLTDWLRENEYLVKQKMDNSEKEVSVPTQKGIDLGLYSEKAGMFPNEYYRVYYNENAQRFLVDNFRRILTEIEEIRARKKQEKKKAAEKKPAGSANGPGKDPGKFFSGFADIPARSSETPGGAAVPGSGTGSGKRSGGSGRNKASAQPYVDPAFNSLVASIPADAGVSYMDDYPDPGYVDYGQWQDNAGFDPGSGGSGDAGYAGSSAGFSDIAGYADSSTGSADIAGYAGGSAGSSDIADFMGDGWESVDEGLPW